MRLPTIRPMACTTLPPDHIAWTDNEWLCEEKIDGTRRLFYKDKLTSKFISRRISVVDGKQVDKTNRLTHLIDALKDIPHGTILDGEICGPEGHRNSNYTTSVIGSLPARAKQVQEENGYVEFIVFDILYLRGKDLRKTSLRKRRQILKDILFRFTKSPYISQNVSTIKNKAAFYHKITRRGKDQGNEGVVFKYLPSFYDSYSMAKEYRSPYWKKHKHKASWEVIICGFTKPQKHSINVKGQQVVNKNHAKRWISGLVIGQYVRVKKWDPRLITDILKGYTKAHATITDVTEFCRQNVITREGKRYIIQPLGVTTGMNELVRDLISRRKPDYYGKVIEIEANERTKNMAWRHPRFMKFREDKPKELVMLRKGES
jgi:bifunctional non-homologous end joining protein LigD